MRAELFMPHVLSTHKRAAMIAIATELSLTISPENKNGKLLNFNHLEEKYSLIKDTVCKARAEMSRKGFIERRQGYWYLSSRFENSMKKLVEQWQAMCQPPITEEEKERKIRYVEMAKGAGKK